MSISIPTKDTLDANSLRHLTSAAGTPGKFRGQVLQSLINGTNENILSVWSGANAAIDASFISRASGAVLDEHANALGLQRGQSVYANDLSTTNVYFEIDSRLGKTAAGLVAMISTPGSSVVSDPDGIVIQQGTYLYTSNGYTYVTAQAVTLNGTMTRVFVPVTALTAGSGANTESDGFARHNLATAQPDLYEIAQYLLVGNIHPITNGEEREDDSTLKYRIQQHLMTAATGNIRAVEEAALGVNGVRKVLIQTHPHGVGTMGLLIRATVPVVSQALLDAVQSVVDVVKASGDRYYVEAPTYKAVALTVNLRNLSPLLTSSEKEGIYQIVTARIVNHINNLELGEELVMSDLLLTAKTAHNNVADVYFDELRTGIYDSSTGSVSAWTPHYVGNQQIEPLSQWYTQYSLVRTCEAS